MKPIGKEDLLKARERWLKAGCKYPFVQLASSKDRIDIMNEKTDKLIRQLKGLE